MDFRAAARHLAGELSSDLSMDPTMEDASMPGRRTEWQPDPGSDGMDPASPGGASPFNGAEPFGQPVADDPEWLNPQDPKPKPGDKMPHLQGPDEDVTTLHSARRKSYQEKEKRSRR